MFALIFKIMFSVAMSSFVHGSVKKHICPTHAIFSITVYYGAVKCLNMIG